MLVAPSKPFWLGALNVGRVDCPVLAGKVSESRSYYTHCTEGETKS